MTHSAANTSKELRAAMYGDPDVENVGKPHVTGSERASTPDLGRSGSGEDPMVPFQQTSTDVHSSRSVRSGPNEAGYPPVKGRCPACGAETLFLGAGGYVTCSVIGCSDPSAATDMLAKPVRADDVQAVLDQVTWPDRKLSWTDYQRVIDARDRLSDYVKEAAR